MMTFKSRLCSKPWKLYDFKRICKNQKGTKNAEFHADFNSVGKVFVKLHKKKLLTKTRPKYALLSLLLMFFKFVLLLTFFGALFYIFQRI
jgi:hypothetical protein